MERVNIFAYRYHLKLMQGSSSDDLSRRFDRFPVVPSLEVVEHVYAPREYAITLFKLYDEGGTVIAPMLYLGYWKNITMAFTGKMDSHFNALCKN
jgi:hypothetical protein